MNILEVIIISVLSVIVLITSSLAVAQRIKYNRLLQSSIQMVLDKTVMSEEIERLSFIVNNSGDLQEGFVKFLSESRDMAFEYISEVQVAIQELNAAIQTYDQELITECYNKLVSFLPAENQDMVN